MPRRSDFKNINLNVGNQTIKSFSSNGFYGLIQIISRGLHISYFQNHMLSLYEKCSYSEFFWSVFSRICIEYREILHISPYSVRMREIWIRKTPNTNIFQAVYLCYYYQHIVEGHSGNSSLILKHFLLNHKQPVWQ